MLIGKFPTNKFLQASDLAGEYEQISKACMDGDIIIFEAEIDKNMSIFLKSGIYFAIEKLRHLTMRNMIKKISVALIKNPELNNPGLKPF